MVGNPDLWLAGSVLSSDLAMGIKLLISYHLLDALKRRKHAQR
jgi:hypothetical protein